jgi:hypothetical protein
LYQASCRPAKLLVRELGFGPGKVGKKNDILFYFIFSFYLKKVNFVSSLLSPSQALGTKSLVLA